MANIKEMRNGASALFRENKQSCDNDCMTDDEQVRGAVKVLYRALETSISEMKMAEKASGSSS